MPSFATLMMMPAMAKPLPLPSCRLIWFKPMMLKIKPMIEVKNEQTKPAMANPLYC